MILIDGFVLGDFPQRELCRCQAPQKASLQVRQRTLPVPPGDLIHYAGSDLSGARTGYTISGLRTLITYLNTWQGLWLLRPDLTLV